jgi:hypothetical protein
MQSFSRSLDACIPPFPQPFIDDDQPLRHLFPPVEWLFLPACLAIAGVVSFICLHVGVLVLREALA